MKGRTTGASGIWKNRDGRLWGRDTRSLVYLHERRARYPAITRTQRGNTLILFTCQTGEQECKGTGDLPMVRRGVDDRWWMRPETVFAGEVGEPRAAGTLTVLGNRQKSIVRSHSRQSSGVYFICNLGGSWNYALAGPYNTQSAGMLDEDHFWVYAANEVVIYRKVKATHGEAE